MLSFGEPFIAAKFSQSYWEMGMGPCCLRMSARALEKTTPEQLLNDLKKERFQVFQNCSATFNSLFFFLMHGNVKKVHLQEEQTLDVQPNWVEFGCFSDGTRCIWGGGVLKPSRGVGAERNGERGNHDERKLEKKNVCLLVLALLLEKRGGKKRRKSNYICRAAAQSFCTTNARAA